MIAELGLDALAAYRLTRLVSADVVTRPLRVRLYKRVYLDSPLYPSWREEMHRWPETEPEWEQLAQTDDDAPKIVELVHCRWCVGVYVGFGVLAARRLFPRAWDSVARGLALAAGAALIAGLERD